MEIAHGKHTPTPGRLYLRPSIVHSWTAVKGDVEILSQELSHVLLKLGFQASRSSQGASVDVVAECFSAPTNIDR